MEAVPEQLASYKLASHATAQRAVMAARQALQGVPEVATTSVDMDGAAQLSHAIASLTRIVCDRCILLAFLGFCDARAKKTLRSA